MIQYVSYYWGLSFFSCCFSTKLVTLSTKSGTMSTALSMAPPGGGMSQKLDEDGYTQNQHENALPRKGTAFGELEKKGEEEGGEEEEEEEEEAEEK